MKSLLAFSTLAGLAALSLFALAPRRSPPNFTWTTYESAKQFVQFNDVIFKGKAVSAKTQYGVTTTTFQVLEKLKGTPAQSVPVTHPAPGPGKCGGVAFKPGQIVVIVAQGLPDDL